MTDPRIKMLPDDLVNKIAAGEVIERPASVVKELIENSIDAGAGKIVIEIQNAGKKLIRVSDNGSGMTGPEVELAVERHSTSKINKLDDLFKLNSLGFRGEALPSIASVSVFEMMSKTADNDAGSLMRVEGGKKAKAEEMGAPIGTTVSVRDLFFNTPARKKFLKSDYTEMGHIGDIVSRFVMAYPMIAFELVSDGKKLIASFGTGSLRDAVVSVYGVEIAKELLEVSLRSGPIGIEGLISRPNTSRIDRSYENFFVNGRCVNNFLLNRALEEAYRTLIPNNRYPIAVLFVDLNPGLVDVNVHPSKREVKFENTRQVMNAVREAVSIALKKALDQTAPSATTPQPGILAYGETFQREWKPEMAEILFSNIDQALPATRIEVEMEVSAIQPLVPIYQFKDTYILSTDGMDLVVIDQHAAHERILYDRLSNKPSPDTSQPLLIPETLELNPKESIVLNDHLDYLRSLGFDLEEFGNNSYLLRAVPALAVKSQIKQMIADMISELQELGRAAQLEVKKEKIRKLVACHSAIKAGDKLTGQEMNQLIKDLFATNNPLTCPHGRPTMFKITENELIKRFGR